MGKDVLWPVKRQAAGGSHRQSQGTHRTRLPEKAPAYVIPSKSQRNFPTPV
jgi:hypothetical protein